MVIQIPTITLTDDLGVTSFHPPLPQSQRSLLFPVHLYTSSPQPSKTPFQFKSDQSRIDSMKTRFHWLMMLLNLVLGRGAAPAWAEPLEVGKCPHMTVFDYSSYMCMPVAMEGMPMRMGMVSGNVYLTQAISEPPRGRSALYSTSMIMGDFGTSVGSNHYLNLDLMVTAEKWTVPENGYPLLLQIGERNAQGVPYIDAQHPHSSPIMGLTWSDTVNLGSHGDYVKFSFAPRGESTDGPIAFMHRPTGVVFPDAPIGHHIGQDVGHISSTVIAASLQIEKSRFEMSAFNGQEPNPEKVDLPLGSPQSWAIRYVREFSPNLAWMISGAYLQDPESTGNSKSFQTRYSSSLYQSIELAGGWRFQNALISGLTQKYDHTEFLASWGEEFLFRYFQNQFFGRVEVLERTPNELGVLAASPDAPRWVASLSGGYSRELARMGGGAFYLGCVMTNVVLPEVFKPAYGGGGPWSGKLFLRFGGMAMNHFSP